MTCCVLRSLDVVRLVVQIRQDSSVEADSGCYIWLAVCRESVHSVVSKVVLSLRLVDANQGIRTFT